MADVELTADEAERRLVCLHEAGHLAGAFLMGLPIGRGRGALIGRSGNGYASLGIGGLGSDELDPAAGGFAGP